MDEVGSQNNYVDENLQNLETAESEKLPGECEFVQKEDPFKIFIISFHFGLF